MNKIVVGCFAAVTALSACHSSDALSPEALTGMYQLTQANSGSLPLLLSASQYSRYTLLSEALVFDGRDSVVRTRAMQIDDLIKGTSTVSTTSIHAQYRVNGNRIEIGSFTPCPPDAMCIANDVGKAGTQSISITSEFYGGAKLTYERIGLIN